MLLLSLPIPNQDDKHEHDLRAGSDHLPADLCVTRSRTLPDLMVTLMVKMYDAVSGSENLPVSA